MERTIRIMKDGTTVETTIYKKGEAKELEKLFDADFFKHPNELTVSSLKSELKK